LWRTQSEDLYGNDVHYIDGCLHVDVYALEMEVENAVPRPPKYALDEAYFRERFDREPWTLAYLRHQRDGDWWQKGRSVRSDWSALDVPVYAIGALLDGYRDFVPRILDNVAAPVWAEMGPWNHAWPHDGEPLPDYEWRRAAVRWFKRWLTDDRSVAFEGKSLTVFQRGATPPDMSLKEAPGTFSLHEWPIEGTRTLRLVPQADHSLAEPADEPAGAADEPATHRLPYVAGSGVGVGNWWGEPTGDMSPADEHALVYDSARLDDQLLVLGSPQVRLTATADAPTAHWFARLEDVWPDGRVSLVSGGGINGAQRASRRDPQPLPVGQPVALRFPMRFTTYTFEPGHRIRLVVTNAQFPHGLAERAVDDDHPARRRWIIVRRDPDRAAGRSRDHAATRAPRPGGAGRGVPGLRAADPVPRAARRPARHHRSGGARGERPARRSPRVRVSQRRAALGGQPRPGPAPGSSAAAGRSSRCPAAP